jgi:hypothetical protein
VTQEIVMAPHTHKELARLFLKTLEKSLNERMPGPAMMNSWVRRTVAAAKSDDSQAHLRNPESAFLNAKVVPVVFSTLQDGPWALTREEAREALLNEYFRGMPEFCTRSPSRSTLHPFDKAMGASADEVYRRWTGQGKRRALTQACPDFALTAPFKAPTVFEGKYFSGGSREKAKRELVLNIYQAFYYRSLPPLPSGVDGRRWDYDYACMLAFDASQEGTLKEAWDNLDEVVRTSFWDDANVYVMVLRGSPYNAEEA